MHPSVRASAATTLRTALALGVMVGGPLLFGVAAHATPTAYYVTDPVQCPSEHDQFPGQKCSGGLDICGYVTTTTGDVAQCYDTSTMADPSSPATSNTQYSGVLGGGFVLNCFAAADGAAPFCDNGGAWLCNRASACYTTKQRDTVCAAPAGDVSAYSCGSCRTGYQDCAGDDACEVQTGVTNYPTGANNNYAASCTAQCDTGYLDCDASGAGSGNGCEIQDGAACTVGSISGTYDGCTCVPHKNYFETGTNTSYGTADPLLWGTQYGTGKLVSFNDDTRERFAVFNDGLLFAEGGLSTSGALTWEGAASGSSIWVSTFDGAGLADCDLATDKIVWDATTKRFACATDLSVGTGLDIATGDDRYVNVSGDTMTGALIIDVRGTDLGVGLEVIEAISGSTIFANRGLSTSGSLVWEGAASGATLYVASSVRGSGLTDCDVSTQKLQWDAATGRFSCGTDQNAGLGTNVFSGSVLTILRNYTGSLLFLRTVSGTTIHANTTVTSSGSITWETFASGSSIWVSTFSGAGLTDCDLSTQKLLYDAQTEKFVCSTDQIGGFGTNVFSGAILRLIQNFTGSMLHVNTISGAVIHANTTLSSSGGIVWEGTASGASLWVSTFSGAGLTDCDLSTQKLLYDATTERFTCGTDQNSGGAGTNVFSGSVLTLIRNYSGSLLRLQTISGTTLHTNTSITTSGSITWETIASGSSIWVSTFSGAGLTDCDLSTQKLLYDASTERFTCGTDQNSGGAGTNVFSGSVLTLIRNYSGALLHLTTVSGSTIHANNTLSSSGGIVWETTASGNALYIARSFSGAGLIDCDADNQTLSWDASTGRFGCGDDDSSGANFTAGQGLALNGSVLVLNSSISGSLLEFQTVSGAMVYAERQLSVSGSVTLGDDAADNVVFNGDVDSNFNPNVNGSYDIGNGSARWRRGYFQYADILADLSVGGIAGIGDANVTRQLSVSGGVVLGEDATSNVVFNADVNSSILPNANNSFDLGSSAARWANGWFVNGNISSALSVLGTSSLTGNVGIGSANTTTKAVLGVSGTISGTTVYATQSFSGAGLSDCDASSSKLAWDATTGRFSCGTDQTGASSLTAGQGLALNGTVLTLNGTLTGSLLKFTTVSGSLLYANRTLASSGTLVWEGAGSGSSLYAGTLGVGIGSVDSGLKLEIAGTASGRVLYAQQSLRSSGSLVWEGAASGATLYVGGAIRGSGLSTDCDASSSKLLWDTTTGRFSCGSDLSSTNTAGQGLSLASSTFRLNSTFSGTLLTSYGVTFSSGGALSRLTGYQGYINFPTYGLAIAGTPLITNQGNLTNIHSIRAGEMHLVRGGKFLSKTDYFAATSTPSVFGMTTGDFNGDGYPDMAQAIFNAITVFINNGDGTFATKVDYASTSAGTTSLHMASADVNGDGKLDLISSDYGASTISVFLNRGNGTFLAGVAYSTQSNPSGITTNDFNADGKVDVAVSNYGSNSVSVLLNNGNGTFATQAAYTVTPGTPYGISSADFNGDGEIDLITAQNYGTSYSILLNKGDGTFAASVDTAVTGVMEEIATGDFNGDGKADIAYNKPTTNVVGVVLNNGNMSFASEVTYGTGLKPSMVIAKDVNADGWLDLVASNYDADTVSVLLNNGNGTFATKVDYTTRDAPRMIAADDFNGDGALDLAAVDYGDGYVSVLMNDTRTALHTVGSGAIGIGTYTPGSILSISGSALINPTGSIGSTKADAGLALEIIGTASGRTLFAMNALRSSGALVWEGAGSGSSLYAGTLGVGIGSVDSGLKLEIAGTASGRVLYAQQSLRSSGSLVWEGAASGSTIYIGGSLQGVGLSDCDTASTSKLLWDATTGRFSCGSDQNTAGSYKAGQGLTLNATTNSFSLNATISGSLARFTTVSGSTIFAKNSLSTSGSLMMGRGALKTVNVYTAGGTISAPENIAIAGRYAYIASFNSMKIADVSNPASPALVSATTIAGLYSIDVVGRYAYVAAQSNGFAIYDVSNAASPVRIGGYDTPGSARNVRVVGNYAYVGDSTSGLEIFDVSNPANPVLVSTYDTADSARDVTVVGRYAYISDSSNGMIILDVQNPASPRLIGSYNTSITTYDIVVLGKYAYLFGSPDVTIIDISNPASPTLVSSVSSGVGNGGFNGTVAGRYAYISDYNSGLVVVDVSDPTSPVQVSLQSDQSGVYDVDVVGRYAYVADNSDMWILDINGIDAPGAQIGTLESNFLSVKDAARFNANVIVDQALNVGNGLSVLGASAMHSFSGSALTLSSSGSRVPALLNVRGLGSGAVLFAANSLRSSGSLVWEGAGSGSSLYAGTLGVGIGSVDSGLKLEIAGTASGRVLYAQQALRSSGSLVWEGAGSGATLYVASSLKAGGLLTVSGSLVTESGAVFDAGTFMIDGINNRVGIGTMTPGALLHINSQGNANTNLFLDANGTQNNQSAVMSLITLGDGASGLNSSSTRGWMVVGRGNAWSTSDQQNDFELDYWDGSSYRRSMHVDSVTGYMALGPQTVGSFVPDATIEVLGTISGSLVTQNGAGYNYFMGNVGIGTASPGTRLSIVATGATVFGGQMVGINSDTIATGNGMVFITTDQAGASNKYFLALKSNMATAEDNEFLFNTNGTALADGSFTGGGADMAEYFLTAQPNLPKGTIMAIDRARKGQVVSATTSSGSPLIGVISTQPGLIANGGDADTDRSSDPRFALVGLVGQIPTRVVGEGGKIAIGDGITVSSIPGVGRKAKVGEQLVGIAMEGYDRVAEGSIMVYVGHQSLTSQNTFTAISDRLKTVEQLVSDASSGSTIDVSSLTASLLDVADAKDRAVLDTVQGQINALEDRIGTLGSAATSSGALTGDMRASTLWLASTLAVDGDARIAGDLHLDGALVTNDLFVPGVMAVDGSLTSSSLTVTGDSDIHGTLTLHGPLVLGSGSSLQFGTGLTLADLVVQRSLAVLGDVTIDGFTLFLGDVAVEGELVVARQAGHLLVPAGATGATFAFEPAFAGQPVVTASPNVPVLYAVSIATSSGFTVSLAAPADRAVTFSWVALIVPSSAPSGSGLGLPFPVDDTGTPVSSSLQWNACIRNVPLFDPSGVPYSCSRYHDGTLWYHPDSNLSFVWNDAVTPPYMELPEGYVSTVTETSASVRAAINTVNAEQAPSAPAAPTDEAPADEPAPSDVPPEQPEPTVDEGSAPAVDAPAEPAEEAPVEQPAPEPAPTEPAPAESAVVE